MRVRVVTTSERGRVYKIKIIWSQDRVLGDLTSQKQQRRGFFLHSQLLLVSYLAGKNQTRTKQLHKYRKWIPRARESGVFTNNVWNCMFACCVCFCLPLRVNTVRLYCPLRPLFSLPLPSLSGPTVWFSVALRPQRRVGPFGTGTEWEGGERVKGSTAETARKRPERPWTAARTMEVLRRCPFAIAQRLVHCAVALSTAVLDRVTNTMSVAPLLTNNLDNPKQKTSNLLSPAPPPYS